VDRPCIDDYAPIGDGRSLALVSRRGSIDWLCWPRIDSPSLFGRLLDPDAGHWSIRPVGALLPRWRYLPGTNLLSTRWEGEGARIEVIDWMPVTSEAEKRRQLWPENALLRRVRCERGPALLEIEFAPRPGWGAALVRSNDWGAIRRLETRAGMLALSSDRPMPDGERWLLRLDSGESCTFLLTRSAEAPAVLPPPAPFADATFDASARWWREWASLLRYDGPWRDQVVRSALAVKLLTFAPSGAIVAAGTTSLPERIGGDLNWDYRFCWVRDAALTTRALLSLGYEPEAEAFASWMLHTTRLTRPEMKVLYDVYGRSPADEKVLPWRGYRDSRPVRINNAAAAQLQLDAYGEVIDAVAQLVRRGRRLDGETARMLADFGRFVCRNWERPDSGIWEPRGAPRHHTHSKVLCWVALERLLEMHDRGALRLRDVERFRANRDWLARLIHTRGWNPRLQSFVQTLDGDVVDASALLFGWYGFTTTHDERMRATARRILERLSPAPGLLYRYEQSRAAGEGAFILCSYWYAKHLARGGGALDEAEAWFAAATAHASDLGLLAEEIDPASGMQLGNFPQAFSHIGLIGAALAIEERRHTERRRHASARAARHALSPASAPPQEGAKP